jgi:predicted nucleotidyltransferase
VTEPAPFDLDSVSRIAATVRGARLLVIFGSIARGRPMPWSDVDIGVSGGEFWEGLRVGARIGAALGREPHVVDLDTASEALRFRVAREGILLWEVAPGTWARFQAESALRYFDVQTIVKRCTEGVRGRILREARGG